MDRPALRDSVSAMTWVSLNNRLPTTVHLLMTRWNSEEQECGHENRGGCTYCRSEQHPLKVEEHLFVCHLAVLHAMRFYGMRKIGRDREMTNL